MAARNNAPNVPSGGLDGYTAAITLTRFAIFPNDTDLWTGRDVATPRTLLLSPDIPTTSVLTLTSSDPSRVLVSLDANSAGAGSVSIPAGAFQNFRGRLGFYAI